MFADLIASAPRHDATARPTLLAGLLHLALVAAAVQITRTITAAPPHPVAPSSEVYVTQRLATALPATSAPGAAGPAAAATARTPDFSTTSPADVTVDVPAIDLGDPSPHPSPVTTGVPRLGALLQNGSPDSIWRAAEVDEPVGEQRGPAPVYPPALARMGLTGVATLQYVVGSDGRVEAGSVVVIGATRPPFGEAAATAVRAARFSPAKKGGVAVRQLVQQRIRFTLPGER